MITGKINIRMVFTAVLLIVAAVFAAGCSEKQELGTTEPQYVSYDDTTEDTVPETEAPVSVEMPDYELTYSGALKDVIIMNELDGGNALEFKVSLSKGEVHIFTLRYNTDEGELVTVKADKQGNRVPVAFEMAPLPENLSKEDQSIFFEAQEAVNEIVESLVLK